MAERIIAIDTAKTPGQRLPTPVRAEIQQIAGGTVAAAPDLFLATEFGAVADGATDSAPAINAACQAAHDNGGGTVVLPVGTFVIGSPIGPPEGERWYNVRLRGTAPRGVRWTFGDGSLDPEGKPWRGGTYLRASEAVPVLLGWFDCCNISNLAIDADMRGEPCGNIHLNHTTIEHCEFIGWSGYGLLLNNGDFTDDLGFLNWIRRCNFSDNGEVNGHAIQVEYRFIDSWITDNNIEAGPDHSDIVVKSGGPLRILRNHMNGNRSPRHNVWFDGGIRECILAHNIFEGARREAVRYDAPGWLNTPEYAMINISDNIFRQYCQEDNGYSPILLNGVGQEGFHADGIVISSNTFNSDYHAAHIVEARNVQNVVISNNIWSNGMEDHEAEPVIYDEDTVNLRVVDNVGGNTGVPVPDSSSAPGNVGDIAFDGTYLYVCVSPNTWKRTSLSDW